MLAVCLRAPIRKVQASSCVCLPPQNTTDSSSNSSQKLDGSLQPLESSPLPQRHKCVPRHRHDPHDPHPLIDHFYLDQVGGRRSGDITNTREQNHLSSDAVIDDSRPRGPQYLLDIQTSTHD